MLGGELYDDPIARQVRTAGLVSRCARLLYVWTACCSPERNPQFLRALCSDAAALTEDVIQPPADADWDEFKKLVAGRPSLSAEEVSREALGEVVWRAAEHGVAFRRERQGMAVSCVTAECGGVMDGGEEGERATRGEDGGGLDDGGLSLRWVALDAAILELGTRAARELRACFKDATSAELELSSTNLGFVAAQFAAVAEKMSGWAADDASAAKLRETCMARARACDPTPEGSSWGGRRAR